MLYAVLYAVLCCAVQDPGAYGQLGLSDLFEMREECLREFGFSDAYRLDKEAENDVALQVRGQAGRYVTWYHKKFAFFPNQQSGLHAA